MAENPKFVILTKKLLEEGKSSNNGWSTEQINALGETSKHRGWLKRLNGKRVTEQQLNHFLSLKDAHLKPKFRAPYTPVKISNNQKKRLRRMFQKPEFRPVTGHMTLQDQYRHPNWQMMKNVVLSRDSFMCVNCCSTGSTLHVHHLKYGNTYVWDVPVWYLVTLCEACHSEEHGRNVGFK